VDVWNFRTGAVTVTGLQVLEVAVNRAESQLARTWQLKGSWSCDPL